MFTMGCTGEAAAASFTMDLNWTLTFSCQSHRAGIMYQTSCFWPATRAAGLNGSPLTMFVDEKVRELVRLTTNRDEVFGTTRLLLEK